MRKLHGSVVRGLVAGVLAAGVMVGGREAAAQERFNPRVGLVTTGPYYRGTLAVRVNPIGLFADLRGGYRLRLFNNPSRHILLRNTYVALGASVVASPGFVRPGIALEVQPLAILNLQVLYEPIVAWFPSGLSKNVQTYPNVAAAGVGAGIVSGVAPANNTQALRGWQLTLQGTLQARIGQSLAIRDTVRAVHSSYDTSTLDAGHAADRVYYDPFYDVVAPLEGWVVANDLDVIATLTDLGTNIGLRYSSVVPVLGDLDNSAVTTTTHRLGPLISYTFSERRHSWFNAPTLFLLAQWWIQHQWRTGGEHPDTVTQYMPMFVLGFSFRGDA